MQLTKKEVKGTKKVKRNGRLSLSFWTLYVHTYLYDVVPCKHFRTEA